MGFYKRSRIQQIVQKRVPYAQVLRQLRSFLDRNEPELVYFLQRIWNNQGRAITYKELREAILAGTLDIRYLEEWQQDYTKFVVEYLRPKWVEAMKEAAKQITREHPEYYFDPFAEGVEKWCEERAASFVVEVSETQMLGIRAVVQRAAVLEDMSVDQLARAIRPMVGLYQEQCTANLNYYTSLINHGISEKKALDLSIKYAAKQHRYRGYNIARTELAFAYNRGAYEGTKQAQAKGYMGEVVKIWATADDERVCAICGGLEGKRVAMDDDFGFKTKLTDPGIKRMPPAHPSCRCAVMFEEVAPPQRNNSISTV